MPTNDLDAALDHVAALEARQRRTAITRLLVAISPQPWFSGVYKRLGPAVDPFLSRTGDGWVMNQVYGIPVCLLISTGARSGLPRESPLCYIRDGQDFVVLGTNFGQERHPAWTGNLLASPQVEIDVGTTRLRVLAEQVTDETQWWRLFDKFADMLPAYRAYLQRIDGQRTPRMFRLTPVGVV